MFNDNPQPVPGDVPGLIVECNPSKGVELILGVLGATTLIAIIPDQHGMRGFWLDGPTLAKAAAWAAERNGAGANLYFSLNEPRTGLKQKAERSEIVALRGIAADVDAKNGRSLEQGLDAVQLVPLKPSLVIMSEGGWQPVWLFTSPVPASAENIRQADETGKQIASLTRGIGFRALTTCFGYRSQSIIPTRRSGPQAGLLSSPASC